MKTIYKDITEIEKGIICHQVNTQGIMGAGLAKQIKAKFPAAFNIYKAACDRAPNLKSLLGSGILVDINKDLQVANLFGQSSIGRRGVHTDYGALQDALEGVFMEAEKSGKHIYIPHKMGAGLGGGNWLTIEKMIEKLENLYGFELTICRYTGGL